MLEYFPITPKAELDHRISSLQQHLARQQIDGALILQNTDLFYFAGTTQQAHLYVPAAGRPLLMVRKNLERARSESSLAAIVKLSSPKELGGLIQDAGLTLPGRLGLELDVLPASLYLSYSRIFKNSSLVDISSSIRLIRSVKSGYELECIRRSAAMAAEVAASVKGLIREGMTEIELAGLVEAEARKRGHQGVVRMRLFGGELFYGHLMSGPGAALASCLASPTGGAGLSPAVPQGAGLSRIRANEPILMDYVFARNGYLADQTRIFALKGLPPELVSAHQAMLELQEELQIRAKPGVRAGWLYDFALQWTRDRGLADWFMGADSERIRFIGHGIGLELDEFPFLAEGQDMRLEENMVIALEPKLIIPGKGVVGIEDTHLVTTDGLERLTGFDQQIQLID
ncbi:MAG: Xaa-Pro peptidase family protein [Desulfohalobiaceae bacterium]|nr:Xaa-Pro peptidase family protein [Desulfohalobiaceae bacterium]